MPHDVFISYSSQDKIAADAAVAALESKRVRCWIAPRDIRPGAEWSDAIVEAIGAAKAMVLVFTSKANASAQVRREVQLAFERGVTVIPLRIENIVPARSLQYYLSAVHWLDAMTPPFERHLGELADTVRVLVGQGQAVADEHAAEAALAAASTAGAGATPGSAPAAGPDPAAAPARRAEPTASAADFARVLQAARRPRRSVALMAVAFVGVAVVAGSVVYFVANHNGNDPGRAAGHQPPPPVIPSGQPAPARRPSQTAVILRQRDLAPIQAGYWPHKPISIPVEARIGEGDDADADAFDKQIVVTAVPRSKNAPPLRVSGELDRRLCREDASGTAALTVLPAVDGEAIPAGDHEYEITLSFKVRAKRPDGGEGEVIQEIPGQKIKLVVSSKPVVTLTPQPADVRVNAGETKDVIVTVAGNADAAGSRCKVIGSAAALGKGVSIGFSLAGQALPANELGQPNELTITLPADGKAVDVRCRVRAAADAVPPSQGAETRPMQIAGAIQLSAQLSGKADTSQIAIAVVRPATPPPPIPGPGPGPLPGPLPGPNPGPIPGPGPTVVVKPPPPVVPDVPAGFVAAVLPVALPAGPAVRKVDADTAGRFNRGLSYYEGKTVTQSVEEAIRWWTGAANAGEPRAMFRLGQLYDKGEGVNQSEAEAVGWYRKAADAGGVDGMLALAQAYEKGRGGLAASPAEAARWYSRAAQTGDPAGMYNVGGLYESGHGAIPKNEPQAAAWYRKAADAGSAAAMFALGGMYEDGRGGLPKDENQAAAWYRRAGEAGYPLDLFQIARGYERGENGLKQDDARAAKWYRKAANAGDKRAMTRLGVFACEGRGGTAKDVKAGVAWLRKAADAGDIEGLLYLAGLYEKGTDGLEKNETEAASYYRRAADAGSADGLYKVGEFTEAGRGGIAKSDTDAVAWYRKAAEAGGGWGMRALGKMYEEGRGGLTQDYAQAARWYRQAMARGVEPAKGDLARVSVRL